MPQSTVYFDQRFSPQLVIESPRIADVVEGDAEVVDECLELSAKE